MELLDQQIEVVAVQMAKDVDLDWELVKPEWRKEYRRRAANVILVLEELEEKESL